MCRTFPAPAGTGGGRREASGVQMVADLGMVRGTLRCWTWTGVFSALEPWLPRPSLERKRERQIEGTSVLSGKARRGRYINCPRTHSLRTRMEQETSHRIVTECQHERLVGKNGIRCLHWYAVMLLLLCCMLLCVYCVCCYV